MDNSDKPKRGRPRGHPKTGGRKKGTPNKVSNSIKDVLAKYVESELSQIDSLRANLTSKERIDVLSKLIPYILPRKQEISVQEEIKSLLDNIDSLSESQLIRLKEIISDVTSETNK